jgi:thiol:disulfide interchange protein DsbC
MKWMVFLVAFILSLSTLSLAEISKEKVEKVLPGSPRIDSLRFDQELKLYEVVSQGQVFYLSEDLGFLIIGNVIDLRSLRNLTADRIRDLRKVEFSSLPMEDAIKTSEGNKAIAVFIDPDCPYCKKLYGELRKLKDTSIYIFLYPLSDEGRKRSIQIWCSGKKVEALEIAFNGGRLKSESRRLDSPSCEDHPVDRNLSLGKRLLISGTPTIITERGEIINGYVDSGRIQAILEKRPKGE